MMILKADNDTAANSADGLSSPSNWALATVALFLFFAGCAGPSVYQCDHPYATAWRFDPDVGRFCRSVCDPAPGAAESSDFDVYATQLVRYDCWPIVRE